MTHKQVIIDGVDVSECEFFNYYSEDHYCFGTPCKNRANCPFKQLKRKEKEYEILKIEVEDIAEARVEICNQCGGIDDYNIPCKQIRDLDYGLQLEKKENNKLKQILTEIKPILELYANSKIGEEQLDGTYKITVKNSSVLGNTYITFDPRPAKQALQKISEAECEYEVKND